MDERKEKELNEFQLRNISIMSVLLEIGAVDDRIIDYLREIELDYFALEDKYKVLEQKINIDEKTNLLKFQKGYLTNILKTASRFFQSVQDKSYNISFVRYDIDNFSGFNNRYGHETGDKVLIEIAKIIRENSRPTDYVIRFGGEEIDVILPTTSLKGAVIYTEKVLGHVRKCRIPYEDQLLGATISAGISTAQYTFDKTAVIVDSDAEELYSRMQANADDALYEAKSTGKDRYCIYEAGRENAYKAFRENYKKTV